MKPLVTAVAAVAVLVALVAGASVQAKTPEIDALRAWAEQGDSGAFYDIGHRYRDGIGVPKDYAVAVQ